MALVASSHEDLGAMGPVLFPLRALRTDRPIYPAQPSVGLLLRLGQALLEAEAGDADSFGAAWRALRVEIAAEPQQAARERFEYMALAKLLLCRTFAEAEPGATAVELLLGLACSWAQQEGLGLLQALAPLTQGPQRVLGASLGTLQASVGQLSVGGAADVTVFHPDAPWTVTPSALRSQGKHTPFEGHEMPVSVRATLVAGQIAHLAESFRMNYEVHHGGNSLNNVANLHVIASIRNTEFFEVLLPDGAQKYGLEHDITVGRDGLVHVPNGPGLGAAIDFKLIERKKVAVLT